MQLTEETAQRMIQTVATLGSEVKSLRGALGLLERHSRENADILIQWRTRMEYMFGSGNGVGGEFEKLQVQVAEHGRILTEQKGASIALKIMGKIGYVLSGIAGAIAHEFLRKGGH